MRLIDADALIPMIKYATIDSEIGVYPIKIGFDAIKKVIDEMPTIEVESVIKCKDCEYYNGDEKYCVNDIFAKPNGYCLYGEKKDE